MCCGNIFSKEIVALILFILIFFSSINHFLNKPPSISQKITPTITATPFNKQSELFKVIKVIDGDTIKIETGETVRYIGIDTPELGSKKKTVQCFAQEAYQMNKKLVEGKLVKLERDVSQTDKYGRLLRYVFVEDKQATNGAIFVNQYLVAEGYAFAATFPPDVKYADLFRQEQEKAINNQKGLWKSCKN